MGKENNIPKKCRTCAMFSGAYCDVHQHLIEDSANCSEWTGKDYSEDDMRISVARLRDVLEEIASSQFMPRVLDDNTIDEIIERVKKEI